MVDRIVVKVIRRHRRRVYALRWKGGERQAKAKWGDESTAYREAFDLESRLNNPSLGILEFSESTRCYEEWCLCHHSDKHFKAWIIAKNRFVEWCKGNPPDIHKINSLMLAQFAADVSKTLARESVRNYCTYLGGFFRWCKEQQWINDVPTVSLPRRKKGEKRSKGRPLTGEEFDRFIGAIPKIVKPEFSDSWSFLAKGLWESSLRLGEALDLHWTDGDVKMNLSGEYPMIDFKAMGEKGRQVRQLPITPQFFAMVKDRPQRGYVFRPVLSRGVTRSLDTWSHTLSDFGEHARILVDTNERTGKQKYASAHDLRRSFLDRWKGKVDVAVLQILARHESLDTTQKYYLGDQARQVAEAIWD